VFEESKSRKRRSDKSLSRGTTLSALALIVSIVALGLGLYQFILPTESRPVVYIAQHDDIETLGVNFYYDYFDELELTFTTKPGDSVLLEFNCELYLDTDTENTVYVHFVLNGSDLAENIHVYTQSDLVTTGYMRHYIESSEGGVHEVLIYTYIDEVSTSSYISDCLLTVTIY
jgi:hypothetical protein